MTQKRFIPALALAALASLPLAARADLMKQGAAYNRDILVTDTTGANVNSLSSGAFTVTQSQAGGAATTITPTITFKASGHYNVAYTAAMTATLGNSALVITATGAVQTDVGDQIVAFDPNGANLGLTNLDAAVSTRSTFAGGAVASVTAPVTVTGTVVASNLPADYQQRAVAVTLPTTAPTGYGAGAGGGTAQTGDLYALLNPLVSAGKFTAPALSLAPATALPTDFLSTAEQSSLTAAATGTPSAIVAAMKADTLLAKVFNRAKQAYTYNLTTHVITLMNDDGTTMGTVTLTIDPTTNTITSKQ